MMFAASSENYRLDQEAIGFVEFDSSSANYESKAAIGVSGAEFSTSNNYIIDQGRVWAITPSEESEEPGEPEGPVFPKGGGDEIIPQTGVSFSGRAYPLSRIELLKDGQIVASTIAGPDARFSITVTGLNAGIHVFFVIGKDKDGIRSLPFVVPVTLTKGVIVEISGIFLSPTLAVDKEIVKQGHNIAIFGQTTPESVVTIGVASSQEIFYAVGSAADGVFLYNLDTAFLELGNHETRAKATKDNEVSGFGRTVDFVVGTKDVLTEDLDCAKRGDLNDDCRVNIVDFSIAGYWYKRGLSDEMRIRENTQLNGDGIINIIDLSIMAFNWTG